MLKRSFMHSLVAATVLVSMVLQGTWVLAGTTGGLGGTVTQTDSGAPISGAKVTVTSPSQTATTTTDAGGHFTFVSLAPDTYTLSIEKAGFEPAALSGISVLADQHPSVSLTTRPTLQTIGRVTARSAAALVKPGTTADVYSVSAAQQTAVQGLGGGGSLNQAYSAISSVPGVFVPNGQNGIYQSVYVRGGNYTELGYEFDGVPIQRAFDQYPSTFISSLGQQELQVYTGAAPADAQSTGLAGFINQVIKTGTYPGFANVELGLGTPTFYHRAMLEVGGATTNRNFSYYVAVAGYNQQFRFGSQYNGAQYDPTYGTLYNLIANNCGTRHATAGCGFLGAGYANAAGIFGTPLAPNGYALGPFVYDFNGENDDREAVVNLHIGIPHKNGTKDDIQLLYDNSWIYSPFQTSYYDWASQGANVLNGTAQYTSAVSPNSGPNVPNCFSTSFATFPCAFLPGRAQTAITGPIEPFSYWDTTNYNGPMGVRLGQNNLTQVNNYYFPNSSPARAPFAQIPQDERDSYNNSSSVVKVQYQKNFGSNAFARVYGYTLYSDWLQNGPDSTLQNFTGGVSPNYQLITHTRGVVGSFVDQLNSQNLLNFSAGYIFANTVRWNNAFYAAPTNVAVAVNASNPLSGLCYKPSTDSNGNHVTGAMTPVYCGSSTVAAYSLPGPALSGLSLAPNYGATPSSSSTPSFPGVSLNTLSQFSCGGGPCEFYTVENGQRGAYNTVAPAFSNFELSDNWKPSERWNVYGGLRWDDYIYHLTDTTVPAGPEPQAVSAAPRVLWQNSYNLFHCVQKGAVVSTSAPNNTASGACPSGYTPANVSVTSPGSQSYNVWQPRLGATYTFDPLDVVRASWGEYAQPSSSAFQQYNNAEYNLPNVAPNTSFYPLGYFDPSHQVFPEESYNLDLSWEHQQKNTDISWKLTPFLRKTRNELYTVLLDPKTAFVSAVNVGNLTASGAEFLIQKGDFSRNGLSGQLALTYTYATVNFGTLPTGGTVLDGVNQSIVQYNQFTSYCANHQKSGLCSAPGVAPYTASACYGNGTTSSGGSGVIGVPCSTKNAIANPYWNSTPQGLYDTGASYIAYNQLPGTGVSSVSSSYNIPWVSTLLVNYKHDRWAVSPALQMEAGGRYGSPTQGQGINPATCTGGLPGLAALDPRYQNGAVGGHPYDASTCSGNIVAPNFQSGHFDNFGAFVEPTVLALSLQTTYQVSNKLTLRLTAANMYTTCFGGTKAPWTSVPYQPQAGCWFGTPAAYIGNFYNPGDNVQQFLKNSYSPQFGNVFQQAYGGQSNPFQLFITAEMKI